MAAFIAVPHRAMANNASIISLLPHVWMCGDLVFLHVMCPSFHQLLLVKRQGSYVRKDGLSHGSNDERVIVAGL